MLEILNRYAHGMVLVPFLDALRRHGCLAHLASLERFSAADACERFSLNAGYFAVALRMFRTCGWLAQIEAGSYRVTPDFRAHALVPDDVMSLYAFPYDGYVKGTARRTLRRWLERSERRWDSEHASFPDYLDGVFIVPLLLALKSHGRLGYSQPADGAASRLQLSCDLTGRAREEVERLLLHKRWAEKEGDALWLLPAGQAMLDRIQITAALAAYRPMFSQTATLLGGTPDDVFALDRRGHEKHLDRTLNVIGSGFQHQRYFAALSEFVRQCFDDENFAAQPKYLADTGCGDGSLLLKLYDMVRSRTRRGQVLDQYPLTLIAIDWNEKALRQAAATLAGTPHLTLRGDIGNPAAILADLQRLGVGAGDDVLHVRSFLDHDRPYLPPVDTGEAQRRNGIGSEGVFVDRSGGLIPARDVFQSTVEHLRRWSAVLNRNGLLMLEVHALDPSLGAAFIDESESLHFDAYHSMSRQFLLDARSFLLAAAEAGLFCIPGGWESYPKRMGFTRITLNHFRCRSFIVRHLQHGEHASLADARLLWRASAQSPGPSAEVLNAPPFECTLVLVREGRLAAAVTWQQLPDRTSSSASPEVDRAALRCAWSLDDRSVDDVDELLQFVQHYLLVDKTIATVEGLDECRGSLAQFRSGGAGRWEKIIGDMRAAAGSAAFASEFDPSGWERELADFSFDCIIAWLRAHGVFQTVGERHGRDELITRLQLAPKYHRYFDSLLSRLAARGLAQVDADRVTVLADVEGADCCDVEEKFAAFERGFSERYPHAAAFLEFTLPCLRHFDDILSGRVAAAAIMFPDGDMEAFAGIFDGEPISAYFNGLIATAVGSTLRRARHHDRSRVLSILEVGGGTGGTTLPVLQAIEADARDLTYVFSDISPAFLRRAQGALGANHACVQFRQLDIEKDLSAQGFEPGAHDVVIAANVLHDTRDIAFTLRQVRQLLAPGGTLLLTEYTEIKDWLFFSGALLHGMWLFEDGERRLHEFCLLSAPQWRRALDEAGFAGIEIFSLPTQAADERCGQCVIVCRAPEQRVEDVPSDVAVPNTALAVEVAAPAAPAQAQAESSRALQAIDAYVRDRILSTLGPERSRSYHATQPLMQLGLDSVELVELKGAIGRAVGLKLSPAFLFEHETPAKIVAALAQMMPAQRLLALQGAAGVVGVESAAHSEASITSPAESSAEQATVEARAIAVIGMACKLPGATTPHAFWELLQNGEQAMGSLSSRWQWPSGIDVQGSHAGIDRAGLLSRIDEFDADFFQISPREAELMDPQQRLLLELSWEAMERAGYRPSQLAAERTGVFVGACHSEYRDLLARAPAASDAYVGTGSASSMLANRLSYFYDFRGPSVSIDTACSSSLVAMDRAVRAMRDGECEQALLGAVNLICSPVNSIAYYESGMLSRTGTCRAFDQDADGFVRGEGAVVLLLKPLSRAVADRDTIHGVILGTAIGHGGRAASLTAPKPASQAAVIERAMLDAGIRSDAVQYIEAHGTGTQLGDVVEIAGLEEAFRRMPGDDAPVAAHRRCGLGSVKTNIGHLEGAAGLAGVMKVLLAMRQQTLPASRNFRTANPGIDLDAGPFRVIAEKVSWERVRNAAGNVLPRMAGVSSFGFGGVNSHVILREPPPDGLFDAHGIASRPEIIVLSARTAEQLRVRASSLLSDLDGRAHEGALRDIAYTLQLGREPMDERLAFAAESVAELRRKLVAFISDAPPGEFYTNVAQGSAHSSAADIRQAIQAWLQQGDDTLLQLWVQGHAVAWQDLYAQAKPRRIELSAYPFARDRYWVEPSPGGEEPMPSTGPTLRTLRWEPATPTAGAELHAVQQRWVLLYQPSASNSELHEAAESALRALPGIRCERWVERCDDSVERYEQFGWRVLERLQTILKSAPRCEVLLQVVFSTAPPTPLLRGLSGLLKTAHLENPQVRGQLIELEPGDGAHEWVDELAYSVRVPATNIRYRGGVCQVEKSVTVDGPRPQLPWRAGGTYLITGGAGGLGLTFAQEILGRMPSARVVLVGRSELSESKAQQISQWAKRGLAVAYQRADLSQLGQVRTLIEHLERQHGALDGVIHGAGVIRDSFLLKKTHGEYAQVMASKVRAAVNLDEVIGARALDFFVMFSSVAGVTGNIGQGDYAAANAFLDAYARHRERLVQQGERHGRSLSIAWPWWAAGGMQIPEPAREQLRAQGVQPLQAADGIAAFYMAYGSGCAQVEVQGRARVSASLTPVSQMIHVEQAHGESPRQGRSSSEIRILKELTQQRLRQLLADVTKLSAAKIDASAALERYGIDSIMIMRLNVRLGAVFGSLSKTLFYEHPTLDSLRDHLLAQYPDACAQWCELAVPQGAAPNTVASTTSESFKRDQREREIASAREPIAIIGLSGRYPGARDLRTYWENLRAGRDSIGEIPEERWPLAGFYDSDVAGAAARGRSYSKWGGFIDGFSEFDALFFGIAPRDAEHMDPQERIFLQACWEAMEDAGYTREALASWHARRVGVFGGVTKTGFDLYGPQLWQRGEALTLHTSFASLANRVSYVMNLQGPSMSIDTMCSASLTAVHEACEHLLRAECEVAISGGVNLYLHPSNYLYMCSTRMLSPEGRCKAFGARADGFVPGEGVGVVVLKRLSQAVADRDHIYASIRATSVNHGGKTNGYTVPNPLAQRDLVAAAIAKAGVDARTISYIEAHGTGTELGDPIEIAGLAQAFELYTRDRQFCAIGSVKSSIGHCESAAGIAGLTKILLQMKHGQLVPSLHASESNPHIDFAGTPFIVQQQLAPWRRPQVKVDGVMREYPRLAGLSSFGAGGANAHVLVEEYVPAEDPHSVQVAAPLLPAVIVLSAKSSARLQAMAQRLLDAIDAEGFDDGRLADIAYTLQVGREAMGCRLAFTAGTMQELRDRLRRYVAGDTYIEGLHLGEEKSEAPGLATLVDADDLRRLTAAWFENREYRKLCELWVNGFAIDWQQLHANGTARRISLPTYPFERTRYWIAAAVRGLEPAMDMPAAETTTRRSSLVKPNAISLRPLHQQTSSREAGLGEQSMVAASAATPLDELVAVSQPPAPERAVERVGLAPLQRELGGMLARALYMEAEDIDPRKPFAELGLDSIIGVEWLRAVNARYQTQLPTAKIYDCPTLLQMAQHLHQILQQRCEPSLPPARSSVAAAASVRTRSEAVPADSLDDGHPLDVPPRQHRPSGLASATSPSQRDLGQAIAIIGMSARYPQASDLDEFWNRLAQGVDCVVEVPEERWNAAQYYDPQPGPGKITCKWLGALRDIDGFDPLFFSISPAEAQLMDPQQRLFLQEGYKAFEDAGYNPRALGNSRCGVYLGIMGNEYAALIEGSDVAADSTGNSAAIAAARISYILDLKGPAISIDTACSSSLVATHLACQALRNGEVDMALAGGVTLYLSQQLYVTMCAAGMLSSDGRCKALDNSANGFVPGEGVGALVLKRLSDAQAAGDPIHGVIIGSGINQDGRTNGITAPSANRQSELQREVYERYGIDPKTIGYVEMHGTGTKLGDPIELEALLSVYGAAGVAKNSCALGSVKSNIGHTSAAAGVAGVHKVLLSLRHRQLVPTLHFKEPNEHFDFANSPFYVSTELREWQQVSGACRRAAVSSFGYSGTNAHVVIEEYLSERSLTARSEQPLSGASAMFVLSARTAEQLRVHARRLLAWMQAQSSIDFEALTCTLQMGREAMEHRLACTFDSAADLFHKLQAFVAGERHIDGCYRGEVKRNREALAVFTADEDLQRAIEAWIAKGKHDQLLDLWVKGLIIDWRQLRGASIPPRTSLPTYPFASEKYWVSKAVSVAPTPSASSVGEDTQSAQAIMLAPHWEPATPTQTPVPIGGEHWVLLAGWPQSAHIQSCVEQLPDARVEALDDGGGTPAERVEHCGWQLLQRVQHWLQGKPRETLLIQIVIPAESETLYALSGLLKTARLEHPLVRGQVISISDLSDATTLAQQLQASAASDAAEIRYEGATRYEQAYRPLPAPRELQRPWKRDGVYLITGGAGGLGLIFAEEIGRSVGAATVVLSGRSVLSEAKREELQRLQALGLAVDYQRVDISSAVSVERLLEEIVARYGRLDGIVHSAGVIQDSFLLKKREAEYRAVLAPKVQGVWNLDRASRKLQLDFFVMFSSASGGHGNVGQGDYALANAFMDWYARDRARAVERGECTGRTVSVGWPLWAQGGMQVDALRREELRALGVEALHTQQGIQALYEAYGSAQAQVQVLYGAARSPMQTTRIEAAPSGAPAWSESEVRQRTLQQLQMLFSAVTKLSTSQIDVTEPLESYGIDSIMIMQLNLQLASAFGELSKTLFYEYPTLAELGDYLVREHLPACTRWCGLDHVRDRNSAAPESLAAALSQHQATPAAPESASLRAAPEPYGLAGTTSLPSPSTRSIAIIGLSGRYAQARDLSAYWDNLRNGRDCITEIPAERWSLESFYEPQIDSAVATGRSYSKWGGFIDGFAEFDSLFFNISPRETLNLDPQERVFLESCWEAMENAGYTRERFASEHQRRVGVFAGITKTGFDLYGPELWRRGETIAPWTSFGSLANRVSYVLNLQGPSMPIDTMCSASLTAVHEACEHLLRQECELAFAGGVNLYLHPVNYAMMCSSRMLSATGRCHSFGADGDGFVPGEGVGVVLLKPLSQAVADRDYIHGVVRATSINHDGKTNGYTVPNPVAQRELIAAALAKAGVNPRAVSYIEAHGTGTQLGDPIEITGLTQAFEQHTADKQFCAIGSAKSNIGHCESAAGIAGLTKVLLQMKHRQLVPSLHADTLNSNIDFADTPFVVQRELSEWRRPKLTIDNVTQEYPRIAGISSFGAGGANAHVIVEEYVPALSDLTAFEITPARPAVVVLSARSEDRLRARAQQLLDAIAEQTLDDADLASLAYTLQVGREAMEHRLGLTVSSLQELTRQLQRYLTGEENIEGLYRGEVKRNKEALSIFTADEELHEAIAKWLARGKYAKVLSLWVKGLAFDWARLYSGAQPRIMPLPTYPFARERHWFADLPSTSTTDISRPLQIEPAPAAVETYPPAPGEKVTAVGRAVGKPSIVLRALSNTPAQRSSGAKPQSIAPVVVQPAMKRVETVAARRADAVAVPSLESIAESLTQSLAKALFIERKNVGEDDVFVELGLDSIVGVEWTHVINRTYGLTLPATRLYDHPTIRELSVYVAAELGKRPAAPQTTVVPSAVDPSPVKTPQVPPGADATGSEYRHSAASSSSIDESLDATATLLKSEPSTTADAPPLQPSVAPPSPAHAGAGLLEGIAIIGISGRFPQARDVEQFWNNIAAGKDCVGEVPRDRWAVDDFYDGSGETLGTTYCRTMGAVEDVAQFDPLFFGIAPSEAYVMDPQQRLFLQACWECIEDAAIDAASLAGTRCAVYAGCGAGDYGMGAEAASAQGLIGGSSSILAARISYFLDLRGPCLAIDTACSSSLVAIAGACDSLVLGQSELALAGGVCVLCSPAVHVTTSNAGMLSKTGRCFAFDQRADGFVPAEGVGVVLLKRLGDALRDRDQVHGVIRGWGVNQDGKTNGITAPSVKSQIALEREVYQRFNIDPRTITLVEAHGTGTKLGDPIEVEALVAAFDSVHGDSSPSGSYCALGSVKSNIGHALTAAAVASVIKVLLAMRHRQLPPTLHFERLNEHINLRDTPFYVNTSLRDWTVPANVPRRAAVSSFGFSGTNAHCVIEEAPRQRCNRVSRPGHLIVLSAKSLPQLREQALRLAAYCQRHPADCDDVSYTLLVGRKHFNHRLAFIAGDERDLCRKLLRWAEHGDTDAVLVGHLEGSINEQRAVNAYGNLCISESRTVQDPAAYVQRLTALAELYVQGHQLEYGNLFATDQCRRICLPTYPFAQERYWFSHLAPSHEAPANDASSRAPAGAPLRGIVDAVMKGTLDVGSAAAELRRLVDEVSTEQGGDRAASGRAGAGGPFFDGRVI